MFARDVRGQAALASTAAVPSMKVRRLKLSLPGIASSVERYYGGHSPEIAAGYFARARNATSRGPTESRGAAWAEE